MSLDIRLRCAIVLNEGLAPGLAANAAAVLAASVGQTHPEIIGRDVTDGSGGVHPGITSIPFPILRANAARLKGLAVSAHEVGLEVCGFTDVAQTCRTYHEYGARMAATLAPRLVYAGVSLFGDGTTVKRLTAGLALYR